MPHPAFVAVLPKAPGDEVVLKRGWARRAKTGPASGSAPASQTPARLQAVAVTQAHLPAIADWTGS